MDNKEIDRLVASWYRYMALGAKSEEGAKHVWAVKTLTALIPGSIPEPFAERIRTFRSTYDRDKPQDLSRKRRSVR